MQATPRLIVLALLVAAFVALAAVALDRPGYNYDEVAFVPVSLRALGQCDVDAPVARQWGCLPLLQTHSVGAVKAWLHAPVFAVFGTNVWTVRLPSILIAAVALVVLWSFARRELGGAWAILLLVLLAGDPVLTSHARLDWGPQVIGTLMRVTVLVALWRWLQTGSSFWLVVTCAAMLAGFGDRLDFIWVIGALVGAAALVAGRLFYDRLRTGVPWQPVIAGVTAALLLWGTFALVDPAANAGAAGSAASAGIGERLAKLWQLYAMTFSGTSVMNRVFGTAAVTTSFFNVLVLVQLVTAAALLALWRPWTPARRFLAYQTVALVLLIAAIAVAAPPGDVRDLFVAWPLPTLHLVTLLAIAAQHAGSSGNTRGPALRRDTAVAGAVVCGALLAWNVAWQLRYIDVWQHNRDYRAPFDRAIADLSTRIEELKVDRVIAVDGGLHPQLVTLADRSRAADFREWTSRLPGAPDSGRDARPPTAAMQLPEHRIAFVLHGPSYTTLAGARDRLEALLRRDRPCARSEDTITNVAGRPLYEIVVADYRNC